MRYLTLTGGQSNVAGTVGGISSDMSKNYCHNEPCMMHGKCIPLLDGYECQCSARYSGKNCQIDNGRDFYSFLGTQRTVPEV